MICSICQAEFKNCRSLASHIQIKHLLKSEEYTIKYILNGIVPQCLICTVKPRYVSFSFKKYCKKHCHIAESEAGKIGDKLKKHGIKDKQKK